MNAPIGRRFAGKGVLVTGATRGIGKGIALAFAAEGADVAITARDAAAGDAVVYAASEFGGRVLAIEADLRTARDPGRIADDAARRLGRLDVLVNNAAVIPRGRPVGSLGTTDADWLDTMAVNVDAAFWISQAAARRMLGIKGCIVNIASEMGIFADWAGIPYCVSKAALIAMTRAMALDLAARGVRVNAVAPGETRTAMMDWGIRERGEDAEAGLARLAGRVPMKRIGTVAGVAAAVMYLASDEAEYVTGAVLRHDGGTTAAGPGGAVLDFQS